MAESAAPAGTVWAMMVSYDVEVVVVGRGCARPQANRKGLTMPMLFYVQGFRQKGRKLEPDQPQQVKSSEAAIALAERINPVARRCVGLLREC
jgi:hypothetical protein